MIRFFCFLLLLTGLYACRGMDPLPPDAPGRTVTVELSVRAEALRAVTRATDEESVRDINLYLFGRDNGFSLHRYGSVTRLQFECSPGNYRLYVVANRHADLGDMSESQLAVLSFDYRENYADLPMSYAGEVTVTPTAGTLTLPAVEVRRRVAKVACNISVGRQAADIELKSVCLYNIPRKGLMFGDGTPVPDAAGYTSGGYADIPSGSASRHSAVFYIPENPQGTVPAITDQRQKNCDNAPAYATYLMIRAVRGERVLDYRVYLGENNTSDFNVRANTHHTLDIVLLGDNEADTRVHGYTLTVWDDLGDETFGGYCLIDTQRSLYIDIEGNAAGLSFYGKAEFFEGDTDCVEFDRIGIGSYFDFEVRNPQGRSSYEIAYSPQLVTADNERLCYSVTVTDEYGFSRSYDFEHRYANEVCAYVKYGNTPNGEGSVTVSGALYSEKIGTTQNVWAVCSERGCTFRAVPADGYIFAGWYKDNGFKTLLSAAESYAYVPTTFSGILFPKFERDPSRPVIISTPWLEYDLQFTSSEGYEVEDLETLLVPYGSRCTIETGQTLLFEGWYDGWNPATRKLVSRDNPYAFTATENRTLVPVRTGAKNLSANGTSNCYITPSTGTAYFFDATFQGNGRPTTGITPTRIAGGTTARVIWETGTVRGAVIKGVEYSGNEIYFVTGNNYGNAVIGLFDDRGTCLWSWHIWVTDYDPAATVQSYTGGRVFMDRNLGALSPTGSSVTSHGLYYQWGRKDPFVYPAAGGDYSRYPVVYGEGFYYDCTDPMMGYGEMTLDFAIANPWTFMMGIYMGNSQYEDTPDWLSVPNPNLWGNASSSTALSDAGSKSIYDPCPPGWRVPDRKAFADANLRRASSSTGYDLLYFSTSSATAFYPRGGYWSISSFKDNGTAGYVWTNAPAQYQSGTNYYKHYSTVLKYSSSGIEPLARMPREIAAPVRCVRE